MPLKISTVSQYYFDYFQSDDVFDEVIYGREEYPVVDLCKTREFDYAFLLLQKGYRCLHGNVAHDIITILQAAQTPESIECSGRDKIPDILDKLSEELNCLNKNELQKLVKTFQQGIEERKGYTSYTTLVPFIREKLPILYNAFLHFEEWTLSDLIKLDIPFWKDYIERLTTENRLKEFIDSNKLDSQNSLVLLSELLDINYLGILETQEDILYQIESDCTGIFPSDFICDVAILASIGKLRIIANTLDDGEPGPDTEIFRDYSNVQSIMGRLYRLLHFHMTEDFSFNSVAQTLIDSCGKEGTEYDLEPKGIPQTCDYYILDAVVKYVRQQFTIDKIPVSENTLENATILWIDIHDQEDWQDNYELAMPEINKLVNWFYDNCDIR